jgi:hypothetical protein
MEVSGQLHVPTALLQGKKVRTLLKRDWVGAHISLNDLNKKKTLSSCRQ